MFIYFPRSTTYLLVNLAFNAVILGGAVVTRCPFFGQDCCSIKNLNKLADVVEPMTIALFLTFRLLGLELIGAKWRILLRVDYRFNTRAPFSNSIVTVHGSKTSFVSRSGVIVPPLLDMHLQHLLYHIYVV